MWNTVFKGTSITDTLINEVTGVSSDLINNVTGICFHAITPPDTVLNENIVIARFNTLLSAHIVDKATFTKNIGDLYIPKRGNYTDYMSEVSIYLPYVGIYQLDPTLVIGKTIKLKYVVDVITGACVAEIFVDGTLLYTFYGNEGCQIPFSLSNATDYVGSVMDLITSVASGAVAGGGKGAALSLLSGMNIEPPSVSNSSGSTSGSISQIMTQKPFVVVTRPKQVSYGNGLLATRGRMLNKTVKLSELSGLTIIENARFDTIDSEEPSMMDGEYETLLRDMAEGVIL